MRFFLFLDESGDHGLSKIDKDFPVFALCGIIICDLDYKKIKAEFNIIKKHFWNDKKVIFHSRDIRKCEKEFKILLDYDIKQEFYQKLDKSVINGEYSIICSIIDKEKYIKKYGKKKNDVYEIALSFIIERSIFYLDSISSANPGSDISIHYIIEMRGKKEDNKLRNHFYRIRDVGTYYITPERMKDYNIQIHFRDKKNNINGLQLADLIAYPVARYAMDTTRANPAFDIFKSKIYSKGNRRFGLKIFP